MSLTALMAGVSSGLYRVLARNLQCQYKLKSQCMSSPRGHVEDVGRSQLEGGHGGLQVRDHRGQELLLRVIREL